MYNEKSTGRRFHSPTLSLDKGDVGFVSDWILHQKPDKHVAGSLGVELWRVLPQVSNATAPLLVRKMRVGGFDGLPLAPAKGLVLPVAEGEPSSLVKPTPIANKALTSFPFSTW